MKLKTIVIIQSIVIALLLGGILYHNSKIGPKSGLLSPRVYSGILQPKSFLVVNYAPLKESINDYVSKNNLSVSVYVENMRSGAFMGVNEREAYPPASLNKVIIAMLIMKEIEDNKLSLETKLDIERYRSNAFGTLYKSKETKVPVEMLLQKMLKESDDTAFKTLKDNVNKNHMALILSYLDYYSDDSVDNTRPGEDYETGLVTPKSIYNVFSSLYLSTVLEPKDSEYILNSMTDTVFDIKTLANLPENVTVSHKFAQKGTLEEKYLHDCGIIYSGDTRLFYCIMTKELDEQQAKAVIGAIVNKVYYYVIDARQTLDNYRELYNYD